MSDVSPKIGETFCLEPGDYDPVISQSSLTRFDLNSKDPASLARVRGADKKMILVMIGLPARGKTYTAHKLSQYLSWLGYRAKIFNLGMYRRKLVGDFEKAPEYFNPNSPEGWRQNKLCAHAAVTDILTWLKADGQIAIYDGMLVTHRSRELVHDAVMDKIGLEKFVVEFLWVESLCNDPVLVEKSIHHMIFSPEYQNYDMSEVEKNFRSRIKRFSQVYEQLSEERDITKSYIQVINSGEKLKASRIRGYLPSRIFRFLLNLHIKYDTPIFLSRHGESEFNRDDKIGGDSPLTKNGCDYADALSHYVESQPELKDGHFSIMCSTLIRTVQTIAPTCRKMPHVPTSQWHALVEIEAGLFDGMTYQEIDEKFPQEFKSRHEDKLRYRYTQGESYLDVIQRLEPVIFELEKAKTSVLVIAHRAVLRCILGYFMNLDHSDIPHYELKQHCVHKLVQRATTCELEVQSLDVCFHDPDNLDQQLT